MNTFGQPTPIRNEAGEIVGDRPTVASPPRHRAGGVLSSDYPPPYTAEYRRTRCLRCAKPLAEHRRFTAEDIAASAGATYAKPVNGHRAPLSPKLIGQWNLCEPLPWSAKNGGPQ